jgi:hypothetical protein
MHIFRKNRWRELILPGLLLLPLVSFAQTITTGDLTGTVKDTSDAVVPNATVTLRNWDTGDVHTATTGAAGNYRFSLLKPGSYQISAIAAGLKSDFSRVTVELGQAKTVDLIAKLQATQEVIEVTATAGLMQTDNANMAASFNESQLENLPAPGNDMTAYAFTAPGVTMSTGGGYGAFSVAGLPADSNMFTINGNDNMDPYLNLNNSGASNLTLGSNEIAEATVVVNGYTGQYGRQAGAQVNYVTKSGSNEFHGNSAWYYNERVMNANDWFANANGQSRPFAVSNQWADSIGGPIVKNKAFFFFNNEGMRYVLPSGGPVFIPTTDFANAVLQNLATNNPAAVPFYKTAFGVYAGAPGAAHATPVTSALDPALGCGDISDPVFGVSKPCAQTFRSAVNNLNTEWLMAIKADYNITNSDRIYFRYNVDKGVQATGTDPINSAFNANSVQPSYGGQFGYNRTIGTSMVNQLLLSASYYSAIFGPPDFAAAVKAFPTTFDFNDGVFTPLGGSDTSYPAGRKVRQTQLVDDFSWLKGAHNIKLGINVRKNYISSYAALPNTSGLFTFNSMTDFYNGALNGSSTYGQSFPLVGAEPLTMYSLGTYIQDEWKVRSNLSVTLAMRMDRNSNINCASGCFNQLLSPFATAGHDVNTPYNQSIHTGLKDAFPGLQGFVPVPRIGVAYSPLKATTIRGGFGVFTDLYQGLLADRFITNSPGVAAFTTTTGNVALNDPNSAFASVANSNAAFQNGFANGATLAGLQAAVPLGFAAPTYNTIANNLKNPKYYEWNFEVQQGIGSSLVASLNYVGNHGQDEIIQTTTANAYSPTGLGGLPTAAPDSRFGSVLELNNTGFSNYDGLISSLRWRMKSGFSGAFNYTWSHALDTCSNGCIEPFVYLTNLSVRTQIDPNNLRSLNYGAADYDTRHAVSANFVYTTPKFSGSRLLHNVAGGWVFAGTAIYHSGYPFSILNMGVRTAQIKNDTNSRAIVLADEVTPGSVPTTCSTPNDPCYSASQFLSGAAQSDFGTMPRNSFRGPSYFDTDINLNKTFAVRERYKLMVGAFFFNVLNHPNFDQPNNSVTSGTFGTIESSVSAPTSAYGSFMGSAVSGRLIQTVIKFSF